MQGCFWYPRVQGQLLPWLSWLAPEVLGEDGRAQKGCSGLFGHSWKLKFCFAILSFPLHCGSSGAAPQTSRAKPCLLWMELLFVVFYKLLSFFRKCDTLHAQRDLVLFSPVSSAVVSRGPTEQSWWKGLILMPAEQPQNTELLASTELLGQPSEINLSHRNQTGEFLWSLKGTLRKSPLPLNPNILELFS